MNLMTPLRAAADLILRPGNTSRRTEFSPADCGLEDVNLKQADGTIVKGNEIDLAGVKSLLIYVSWTITGACGAGALRFDWIPTDEDGNELARSDISASKTSTETGEGEILYAPGLAPLFSGFTVGSSEEAILAGPRGRPVITIITENDAATSAVANVRIIAVT